MDKFRIGVKGFIIDENNNLLLLKRRNTDSHRAGIWEPPGGRLEPGEDPFEGLKREIKEETSIDAEVSEPITVRHFRRDDGQTVTMISFICKPSHKEVNISEEHEAFRWFNLDKEDDLKEFLKPDNFYLKEVEAFKKSFRN